MKQTQQNIIPRMHVKDMVPQAYIVLLEMEKFISTCNISKQLCELIKIRASQINKCAYCLEMQTTDARKNGETEMRIYTLSAWEESPHFSDAERAVLAFTEEVTNISKHGVSDIVFKNMQRHFTDEQIAQIIIIIGQINFWNRIAVSTKQVYNEE